jgi:hypothetical protein
MAYRQLKHNEYDNEYECLPLETRHVAAPHLKREFARMERLFEEWFVTLDELKGACDAVEVRRIRTLTDRSEDLVNAIGDLQPPRPSLYQQPTESPSPAIFRPGACG